MIKDLKDHFNEEAVIKGFVDKIRNLQYVAFIIIRDNSGKVQVTVEKEGNESLVEVVDKLTVESTVTIKGKVLENEKVKLNGMEIIPDEIKITYL